MTIILGATYEDKVTGFAGVATGHVQYITGCGQVLIQPKAKETGSSVPDSHWIDETRLEQLGDMVIQIENNNLGSDRPAPMK